MEENLMDNVIYDTLVVLSLIGIYVVANLPTYVAHLQPHNIED